MRSPMITFAMAIAMTGSLLYSVHAASQASSSGKAPSFSERPESELILTSQPLRSNATVTSAVAQTWSLQIVDQARWFDYMTDRNLRLDQNGNPHVVYGGNHLFYAWRDQNGWHEQIVDNSPSVGAYAALALDATGKPFISYFDAENLDLKCARWSNNGWIIDTVKSYGIVGEFTSIAVDRSGKPHITAYDATQGALLYASWSGTEWKVETVDDTEDVGRYTSLALDENDRPHISYFDYTNSKLKYAHWNGNTWTKQTIDNGGYGTSIALDSQQNPHIAYRRFGSAYYAWRNGSSWEMTSVTTSVHGVSLAISQDKPHISVSHDYGLDYYYDFIESPPYGGSWKKATIEAIEATPYFYWRSSSIALDREGKPHFLYLANDELKYAQWKNDAAAIEIVNEVVGLGRYGSLAVDSDGNPHLSYYEEGKQIKYAHWKDNAWQIKIVEKIDMSECTSLALDRNGNPHIVYNGEYYDPDLGEWNYILKYAYWTGNGWSINKIDEIVGRTGNSSCALALDSEDTAHVIYLDGDDLMYATSPSASAGVQAALARSGWKITKVDKVGWTGFKSSISLALNSKGNPIIGYFNSFRGYINVAKFDSKWHTSTVRGNALQSSLGSLSNSQDWEYHIALVIDQNDQFHLTYIDPASGELKYATSSNGIEWTLNEIIDYDARFNSLALDRSNGLHLSYLRSDGKLVFGKLNTVWHTMTVVSGIRDPMSSFTSLAVDRSGRPHIAFLDWFDGLKYVYRQWVSMFLPLVLR